MYTHIQINFGFIHIFMCAYIKLYIFEYTYIYIYSVVPQICHKSRTRVRKSIWSGFFLIKINIHIYTQSTLMNIYIFIQYLYVHTPTNSILGLHSYNPASNCMYTRIHTHIQFLCLYTHPSLFPFIC